MRNKVDITKLRDKVDKIRNEAETNHIDDEDGLEESGFKSVNQKLDTFEEVLDLLESMHDELTIMHELS